MGACVRPCFLSENPKTYSQLRRILLSSARGGKPPFWDIRKTYNTIDHFLPSRLGYIFVRAFYTVLGKYYIRTK